MRPNSQYIIRFNLLYVRSRSKQFDLFHSEMRILSAICNSTDRKVDRLVRDQFLAGLLFKRIREHLNLPQDDLTLENLSFWRTISSGGEAILRKPVLTQLCRSRFTLLLHDASSVEKTY